MFHACDATFPTCEACPFVLLGYLGIFEIFWNHDSDFDSRKFNIHPKISRICWRRWDAKRSQTQRQLKKGTPFVAVKMIVICSRLKHGKNMCKICVLVRLYLQMSVIDDWQQELLSFWSSLVLLVLRNDQNESGKDSQRTQFSKIFHNFPMARGTGCISLVVSIPSIGFLMSILLSNLEKTKVPGSHPMVPPSSTLSFFWQKKLNYWLEISSTYQVFGNIFNLSSSIDNVDQVLDIRWSFWIIQWIVIHSGFHHPEGMDSLLRVRYNSHNMCYLLTTVWASLKPCLHLFTHFLHLASPREDPLASLAGGIVGYSSTRSTGWSLRHVENRLPLNPAVYHGLSPFACPKQLLLQ